MVSALLIAVALPSFSNAQDEDVFDRTPVDCISVSAIDRTDVIDDRTILFHMRGKKIYRNYLPRRCPGLDRHERFAYEVTSNRLCDIDTVTVLEQWGSRLSRGFTCGLGAFHPIPEEEVEELELDKRGNRANPNAIDVEEAELPEDDTAGDASQSDDAED
jgi:hypothetical protein